MNANQSKLLLKIARDSVSAAIKGSKCKMPATDDPELLEHRGCFVTLKNHEELRGCIGNFVSDRPLIAMVHDMAVAAATDDPRFLHNPIDSAELRKITIEISVLSQLQKTSDPMSLRLGVDGIFIKRGFSAGCFLPQVATETGWTVEEFFSYCCSHKAGLPADAWKDPKTEVYFFTADIISE